MSRTSARSSRPRRDEQYDNTNRGALFINQRRETDKHPHFQGQVDVEGVEYWISAWKHKIENGGDRDGELMLSLSVQLKEKQGKSHRKPKAKDDAGLGFDDNDVEDEEIPF